MKQNSNLGGFASLLLVLSAVVAPQAQATIESSPEVNAQGQENQEQIALSISDRLANVQQALGERKTQLQQEQNANGLSSLTEKGNSHEIAQAWYSEWTQWSDSDGGWYDAWTDVTG